MSPSPARRRVAAISAALAILAAGGLAALLWRGVGRPKAAGAGSASAPAIVFIVVDMLRADRLSSCGYGRPTTPNLDAFARGEGAAATCRAYAPGTWTLPSHASFFTGEEVPIHGADFMLHAEGKPSVSLWGEPARPLAGEFRTLAEKLGARGYETVLVSGNPIVSQRAATGLARGFDVVRDAARFGDLYGKALVGKLDDALAEAQARGKPIFLFVNVADAHHPWLPIPDGVGWVPPRAGLDNRPRLPETFYPRFLRGQLDAGQRQSFLEHAVDSYDYAVFRADRTFGAVLAVLDRRGLLAGPNRIVVTSDHGELLGEHELVGHGLFVREGISRVPLMFRASEGAAVRLDPAAPISALTAHDLVLGGALPKAPRAVRAAGFPDGLLVELFGADRFGSAHAAAWDAMEKIEWSDAGFSRIDLGADPGEDRPAPLAADAPGRPALERFVARIQETADRAGAPSKEMIESLRALGYVQ